MPDWLSVVLLGILEGVTEFLPVSSTGHLLLAENSRLLSRQSELFNVVIQGGAVVAVFLVFWRRLERLVLSLDERGSRVYLLKLGVAFALTAAGGLLATKAGFTLPGGTGLVAWVTLIGGALILVIERSVARRSLGPEIGWATAIAVGIAQLLAAVLPGTSRAASTILVALLLGVSRPAATEFSFLVGIPTLFAASGYEIFRELRHPGPDPTDWGLVALGTVASTVVAFLVVRWLLRWVQTHTFVGFGWYRIALGLLMLALASVAR